LYEGKHTIKETEFINIVMQSHVSKNYSHCS